MARNHWQQHLAVMREADRDMTALFDQLAGQVATLVLREAGPDGMVPRTRLRAIQEAAGQAVHALFLGRSRTGQPAPFDVVMGRVVPLSPYVTVLWGAVERATRVAVDQQAQIMRKALAGAPDVLLALQTARQNPFAVARLASEQAGFRPNPFAQYDPLHRFVHPDGYRLSDRIWRISGDARRRLDLLLQQQIAEGMGAFDMAKEIEQFLRVDRQIRRTNKPYGRDASYDAMRLARTEITAAGSRAGMMAAQMNPFVQEYEVVLSGSHPKVDVCDEEADGGPYPIEDTSHTPPFHPFCVTPGQLVETTQGPVPIEMVCDGDIVRTHTGAWGKVKKAWSRAFDGIVYKFSTEAGQFELTGEHPVLLARGWVKAEEIQVGDQVVYAQADALFDSVLPVSENMPAHRRESGIAAPVMGSLTRRVMPSSPIAFDSDLDFDQRKVQGETPDRIFSRIDDSASVQLVGHCAFDAGGDTVFSHRPYRLNGDVYSRIARSFCFGDFSPYFGTLSGIVVSGEIESRVSFAPSLTLGLAAGTVVLAPGDRDALTDGSKRNVAKEQQAAEHAESDTEFFADSGRSHLAYDIVFMQNGINGSSELLFNPQGMVFSGSNAVHSNVVAAGAFLHAPTDGANMLHIGNLSSLPLGSEWGTAPRNAGVGRVMTPPQARLYYTTVGEIGTRHYAGRVYNMSVDGDNSYTVNGACVHNCLCHLRWVLAPDSDAIIDEMRAQMGQGPDYGALVALVGPLLVDRFVRLLLDDVQEAELAL